MSDFTSNFWSVFVTALTLVGIIGCAVLLWMAGRKKVVSTADNTTGHVWDEDLREMNNPLPVWWVWMFIITIVFALLRISEQQLADQVHALATEFGQVDAVSARVSRLPLYLPWLTQLAPPLTFDMRAALALHADGIARGVAAQGITPRDRAFMLSAEIFLLQHTCHWFCKSRMVASARMLAAHKTAHAQLVQSVSPATRGAYTSLVGLRA